MEANEVLLELTDIDKRFGGVHALDNVSFNIYSGEVHAIVGENGAGKSTLMKILAGSYQPDQGEIKMRGERVAFNNPRDSFAGGINIIYQEFFKFPALSVIANIFAGREHTNLGFLNERKMRARAQDVLDRMRVEIDLDATVRNLSVADQQLIEIVKALVYKGTLVIMDEPNSALTDKETQALFEIIRRLKEQGITILYVSHRLEEVFRISDCITVLRDGKYIGTWRTQETSIPFIISQMIGRTLGETFPEVEDVEEDAEKTLEVRDLCKGNKLFSVSFHAREGEVLGFAGLEGSGIRDLFHILFGLDRADGGEAWYKGKRTNIRFSSDAIKTGWGMIPANRRDHGLMMRWSVKENIAVVILKRFLNLFGLLNDRRMEDTATQYVQKLNIATESIDKKVFDLSGGNQQKVVLAKWLATEPKLLILDDPTRGIDVGAKNEVYHLIKELAEQGISILFSSSEIDEVLGLSNRILVMRLGRIIREFAHEHASKAEVMRYVSGDIDLNSVQDEPCL
jgi:ABC-type sugar transport system ATPase subunit